MLHFSQPPPGSAPSTPHGPATPARSSPGSRGTPLSDASDMRDEVDMNSPKAGKKKGRNFQRQISREWMDGDEAYVDVADGASHDENGDDDAGPGLIYSVDKIKHTRNLSADSIERAARRAPDSSLPAWAGRGLPLPTDSGWTTWPHKTIGPPSKADKDKGNDIYIYIYITISRHRPSFRTPYLSGFNQNQNSQVRPEPEPW